MKEFSTDNVRNITLLGHSGSGKSTLAECMLFESGLISRRGTAEEGTLTADYHELEKNRGNSIFSTLLHAPWKKSKINIIDTPGFDDFVGEVISALKVADTGVMMLNAQQGVEVGTELIWEYTEEFKTPMIFVVNQVDHEKSDFDKTVEQAKQRFGSKVTVVQYPLNQGNGFNAIVDVLKMVMYEFPADGGKPEKKPIPDNESDKANQLHNELVEAIAENDEGLMELFFEKGTLNEEEMTRGLKLSMINHDIFPLFVTSTKHNMGSGRVMGFLHDIAPCAKDMPAVERQSGKTLECKSDGPKCAFIYKTISEPHLGDMSFFKVYSGQVKVGDELINSVSESSERITQLFVMNGKKRENVEVVNAGDIAATVKLKNTHTNSTLHEKGKPFNIVPIQFPSARVRTAIGTDNKADIEKLAMGLHVLQDEDPSVVVEHSQELKQTLLHAQGELHLSIIKWKLENNYKLKVNFDDPRIPYRETITKGTKVSYRHKKQSGGAGQFGEVHMLVEPYYENMPPPKDLSVRNEQVVDLQWGGKLVFLWCIVGGSIDAKYQNAIMKGIMEKMEDGPVTGSYVRDLRVSVYDGKMHPVDSNDMAFKLAATMAVKSAILEATPQVLEPIQEVNILVSEDSMGDVMSDIQTRRGVIAGIDADGHYQSIKAKIPLAELSNFSSSLRSISKGRAKYSMKFDSYESVPFDLQKKLAKEKEAAMAES